MTNFVINDRNVCEIFVRQTEYPDTRIYGCIVHEGVLYIYDNAVTCTNCCAHLDMTWDVELIESVNKPELYATVYRYVTPMCCPVCADERAGYINVHDTTLGNIQECDVARQIGAIVEDRLNAVSRAQ